MYEVFDYETHYRRFDSIEELLADVRAADLDQGPGVRALKRKEFVGRYFNTWSDVYSAAMSAWPEGMDTVQRMVRELEDDSSVPKPVSRRRRPRFSEDDGDELDYDRLRSGQPFWRTSRRQSTRGPQTVTIVVDVNARSAIEHSNILWRGAAAIAMTHVLEQAGFRVELWTAHRTEHAYTDGSNHMHVVCLKRAGDPLDAGTLVSAVSGWFLRSVMFRAKCIGDKRVVSGLGQPLVPTKFSLSPLLPGCEPIVIAGAFSYEGALSIAREAIKKLTTPPPPPPPPEPVPAASSEKGNDTPANDTPAEKPKPLTAKERKALERAWRQWRKANRES